MINEIKFYKDENLHAIANYKAIPFNEKYKDNGFIIRVIELFKFTQIKKQLTRLQELTGLTIDNIEPSLEEVIALIERGKIISEQKDNVVDESTKEFSVAQQMVLRAEDGKAQKPDNAPSWRAWRTDLLAKESRCESNLEDAKEKLLEFNSIFGLLKTIISTLPNDTVTKINKKLISLIPNEEYKSYKFESRLRKAEYWDYKEPFNYIDVEFDKLKKNILHIINMCTPSNDSYVLRQWENQRSVELYQYYYAQSDWNIKAIFSAKEYVSYILAQEKEINHKMYLMS